MSTKQPRTNCMDGEWLVLPIVYNDNSETSAKFELPVNWILRPEDMYLIIDTADASETIDLGIGLSTEAGYDANGFVAAYPLDNTGYICVADMYTCTDGTGNYISANYIGELFFGGLNGANAADQEGIFALKSYRGDGTCKTLSYTCSSGCDTFAGRWLVRPRYLPI